MAKKIKETPILYGEDAKRFNERMKANQDKHDLTQPPNQGFHKIIKNEESGTPLQELLKKVDFSKFKIRESAQEKQVYSEQDMIDFAEWCRNGLLNTEYSIEKRKELLIYWEENVRSKTI